VSNKISFRCEHAQGRYELWIKDRHEEISEFVSLAFLEKLVRRLRGNKSLVKIHKFRAHIDANTRSHMANHIERVLKGA